MARRRYFRYSRRTVPKKKWASNFKTFGFAAPSTTYSILCENKSQANAPTPTIIKTGNFKVQGDCGISNASSTLVAVFVRAFILFVPEGWADADIGNIPVQHPEWIMAWTAIDMPNAPGQTNTAGNKFSMTSRLKRNLNSGDKVVIFFNADSISSQATVTFAGSAQFWTCAN